MALLYLNTTPQILATLRSASQLEVRLTLAARFALRTDLAQHLPEPLRAEALLYVESEVVPWRLLHSACLALRRAPAALGGAQGAPLSPPPAPPPLTFAAADAWLHTLARTGGVHLPGTPAARQRSPELVQRLETLRVRAEELQYQTLVTDVTLRESAERGRVPISGAMREIGYGVHVLSVMATCFLVALIAGRSLSSDPGIQCAIGALGMLLSLGVETALFVIRAGRAGT